MNFKDLPLTEIIEKIKSGETDKQTVWDYFRKRIEKYDNKIKSYNFINKTGLSESNNYSTLA